MPFRHPGIVRSTLHYHDISDSVNNSESESSVSDDDCDSHDIPDLEEDHDGVVEEIIDCESSDALPESDVVADVNS